MQLTIISPTKKESFEVSWVECNTPTGNYVIQPGHAPTILALSENKPFIFALKNGKEEVIMIKRAVAEITRAQVIVLLSHIE
jgi:F0F1-type ATP synthase epsilon subunit